MIRFALRLALASGREAVSRLVLIAAAVALGVGLLLTTLAGINGIHAQNDRFAWLNAGILAQRGSDGAAGADSGPLWWLVTGDYHDGETIGRVDVAAVGPDAPVPPGLPRLPGPGEFYVSPALAELLDTTPAAQLGDRYPGRRVGIIGRAGLPAPNSLLIVVGRTAAELADQPRAVRIDRFPTTLPADCGGDCITGVPTLGMNLVLAVVAGALLFPLLMFIGTATRLSAARREQRFAAMRLVGATPRQVSQVAGVEAAVAALAGTIVGFGLFFLVRNPAAAIPFTGVPFFPEDLSLGPIEIALVAVGVPVAAAVAARLALRRVRISPLGVTRRVTPPAPRAYRVIPLVLGIAELAYFVGRRPETTTGQIQAFLSGILLIMVGLVVAGPWLTMVGARLVARWARRPAALIAARRLADDPRAGFRAVSGLILALFVTTVAVGVITTIVAERGAPTQGARASNLISLVRSDPPTPAATAAMREALTGIPGVHGVALVHDRPEDMPLPPAESDNYSAPYALASCAEVGRSPTFGRCPDGATVVWVYPDFAGPTAPDRTDRVWPAAPLTPADLERLPLMSLVVGTDGSTAAIEQARTGLEVAYPQRFPPMTDAEWNAETVRTLTALRRLANVVIIASLVIAGCSLAVSVTGGLTDRKRPFSMLRLTGVPLGTLRRVVGLETVTPLLAAAVVAVGVGFLAAHLFLTAQMNYSLVAPGATYFVLVLGGLAASLGVVAGTLPLLRRITGPETARNE